MISGMILFTPSSYLKIKYPDAVRKKSFNHNMYSIIKKTKTLTSNMQSRTFKKFPRDFTYRFDDVIFESTRITTCVNENYERKVRRLPRKM